MKTADVRKKSQTDLVKHLHELVAELREFRFGMAGGAKKNIRRARTVRRDIARVKTVLNEQQ